MILVGLGLTTALVGLVAAVVNFRRMAVENRDQHAAGQIANDARWDKVATAIGHVQGVVEVTRIEQADGFTAVYLKIDDLDGRVDDLEDEALVDAAAVHDEHEATRAAVEGSVGTVEDASHEEHKVTRAVVVEVAAG
jgi:hypothetical protein